MNYLQNFFYRTSYIYFFQIIIIQKNPHFIFPIFNPIYLVSFQKQLFLFVIKQEIHIIF